VIDLLLRDCRMPDGQKPVHIAIEAGRIASVGLEAPAAREVVEVEGRLVTSGLVDAHLHLDKALLHDRVQATAGTAAEAIRLTGEAKRGFTVDDIRARARRLLDMAIAAGTTAIRGHVEIDPILELSALEAVLPLKTEYAPALDLQLCAFAQEGILQAPGTEGLLRRALTRGADLVGGCPYNDTDARAHIEIVFGLAQAFDVDVDFHIDFFDEPEHLHVRDVIEATLRTGWQGRVSVGHLTELAALPITEQETLIADLAAARIGVIALPTTDLYLMGRGDVVNVRRGITPIRRLLDGGVPVALATNNVRNPFTPIGTADLADLPFLATVAAHMGGAREMRMLLDTITVHPARMLRLPDYGLAVGCRADLVVWDCATAEDAVATPPPRLLSIKHGRITIEHERRLRERWRL
jgi:cytosine/creatinine deaminase